MKLRKILIGVVVYAIWFVFALFIQEAIIKEYYPMPQQEGYEYVRKETTEWKTMHLCFVQHKRWLRVCWQCSTNSELLKSAWAKSTKLLRKTSEFKTRIYDCENRGGVKDVYKQNEYKTTYGCRIYGTNARIENHSVILANAGTYGQVVDGLTEDNYQIDISLVSSEIPADSTLKLEFLAEDNSVLTSYDIFTNGTASTNLVEGDYTYNIEGVDDVTKVQLNYTGETEVAVDLFSIRPTYENVFDSDKEYYESETLTVNGDFEAFEVGTKLSENQLEGAWGSVSLDTPGTIVETNHDGKAVQIGRTDASDTHQYSSFFLMVPPELQIGDLIRFQYEYKLEIQGEPMSYIEINSTFVGGANRSYYLEDLRQLNYDEDYKQTSGVEDIPFPIKYEALEDGWIITTLDFQVTNNKIQWDSVRWIITPQSVGDTLTVDNVSIKYLSETPFVSEVSTVKINEGDIELNAGEVKKLTTTITPADAEDKTITWKSSDTSVATVSSDGTVTAIKEGVCEITATSSNGKSDSIVVTVLGNGGTTSPEDNSNQGLIIGLSVAGAIVALGLIGGLTYYFIRKKKSKSSK